MRTHELTWVTAAPLWRGHAPDAATMQRPAVLRFATDDFMEQLIATVGGARPGDLAARLAHPASYRERLPGEAGLPAPERLKLFQPVHGHFNLIAANLVCQLPGLPDHRVDRAAGDRVSFVLRRLEDAGGHQAWVPGVEGKPGAWVATAVDVLAAGEERCPLFPVTYREGVRRRLFVGLIPTSSRDVYQRTPIGEGGVPPDARAVQKARFAVQVIGAFKALRDTEVDADGDTVPVLPDAGGRASIA
ncbi:MAG: hypothetical protein KC620_20800, partial [Myxococcales bacterium]|nr:hypothetical protein [Myxococcales bacterium]